MRADLLHVVTAVANPLRWGSRMRLFRDFADHMRDSGVQLTVVECAYGDRPHELATMAGIHHVPVRARTMVWTKENLINLGIARLPDDWGYVAWLDADIVFRRADWAAETVHALQMHPVVQPWSDCYDLGPHGEHVELHRSFCRLVHDKCPIVQGPNACGPYRFGHPGYAWAATRQAVEWLGGLVETAALGAADHHMALALIGRVIESIPGNLGTAYSAPLLRWQARAMRHICSNVGYVAGTIEHCWHGAKSKRGYVSRWKILSEHGFDPDTDLKRNSTGVIELAGNKPGLRDDISRYFESRDEDANSMAQS